MKQIVHLASDLMMASTVKQACAKQNLAYRNVSRVDDVAAFLPNEETVALLVDLQTPGLKIEALQQALIAGSASDRLSVWLYAQHVNTELIAQAKELGRGQVVTRGQFNRDVDRILAASAS